MCKNIVDSTPQTAAIRISRLVVIIVVVAVGGTHMHTCHPHMRRHALTVTENNIEVIFHLGIVSVTWLFVGYVIKSACAGGRGST